MKQFNQKLQEQFTKMCATGKLFKVALSGQQVWDLYLQSFKPDPIFRDPASSVHNCNLCNNFIRRYGNIVAITNDFKIMSIFDVEADEEFALVAKNLSKAITSSKVSEVFFETFNELNSLPYESCSKSNAMFQLGMAKNVKRYTKEEAEKFGVVKPNEIREFHHMNLSLPKEFVDMTGNSIEQIRGTFRDSKEVFQRGMETISLDTLMLVKDLINQGSLLDGPAHLEKLEKMIPLKQQYDSLSSEVKDNWCWIVSYRFKYAKFRNELMGVLCSELSEGKEINEACRTWNQRVDPTNYMKATAPITKKQIEEARKFVEENGYTESFDRRFANMKDIKMSEILHANNGSTEIKSVSIFDNVKSTSTRHKRSEFDGVEEIHIDKFMKDILPTCTSIEVFLKNTHEGHMVSLTTANNPESKKIMKWDNNYSWTFNGNLAGKSQIKEAVKTAGGKIDGVLRFSIIWNEDGKDIVDFDAHAIEPSGTEIYYSSQYRKDRGNGRTSMSGQLDVDMINPQTLGVENIVWSDLNKMRDGVYKVFIRNFNGGSNKGFKAEIEANGETYTYDYNRPVSGRKDVNIAEITLKNGEFTIKHLIPESTVSSKEIYGLETNQFHKVKLLCLSPNHWDKNNVGNKHYFFILDNCKAPTSIRGFHNENLIPELLTHRKVMEVLGSTNMIPSTDDQLSGLGFNATVRDEVLVRLSGTHKRVVKIKF